MKLLVIFFLFCSCNKIIYSKRNPGGSYEQLSLLWKKQGEYRGVIIIYNSRREYWFDITVRKSICDSFFFSEYIRANNKKTNNIKEYSISKNGDKKVEFSHIELKLLADLKKVIDSLGWCQSGILSIPDSLYFTEIQRKKKTSL